MNQDSLSSPSDGRNLWLEYGPASSPAGQIFCRSLLRGVQAWSPGEAVATRARAELIDALGALGGDAADEVSPLPFKVVSAAPDLPPQGFQWTSLPEGGLRLEAGDAAGLLYGAFALIGHLQMGRPVDQIHWREVPFFERRMLNHWDNLDATFSKTGELVERGYAGGSLFDFIGGTTDLTRIGAYARALASIGINHVVLNNVNADPRVLEPSVLGHIVPVADILREWGVRVWVSVNFASPMLVGGPGQLTTADPLDPAVRRWWAEKCREIYSLIPDFGGFLVKASSEGEPGPHDYDRDHHDGANALAEALHPFGGICIWRAFVYGKMGARSGHAYGHFKPLDGCFADNVILQIKHGPVDFLPNEPTSPLFGQMPRTTLGLELMATQEYTGQQKHLYYYGTLWEQVLGFDTGAGDVPDPTIAGICRQSIAAVPNIGDAVNWCAHPLAQANWYAFGRMAWNPRLTAREVAREWIERTLGHNEEVLAVVERLLLESHSVYVGYTGPYGLCMLHDADHFSPAPEKRTYVHEASPEGIGKDRTLRTGSGETGLYLPLHREVYEDRHRCPPEHLLYFHRLSLDEKIDGKPVMEALRTRLWDSALRVGEFIRDWKNLEGLVPAAIFEETLRRLEEQEVEANRWARSLDSYFSQATAPTTASVIPMVKTSANPHTVRNP